MNELKAKIVEVLKAHKVEMFRIETDVVAGILILWSHPPISPDLKLEVFKAADKLWDKIEFRNIPDPNVAAAREMFADLPRALPNRDSQISEMVNRTVREGRMPDDVRKAIKDGLAHDVVNHPSHYTTGKIEVIEFIEDQKLNYHKGNAVKYVCRAGRKDPKKEVEDLKKAAWYINREIERLSGAPA